MTDSAEAPLPRRIAHLDMDAFYASVLMPDIRVELGLELRRNVLPQKEWDGRKLIAEGFSQAEALEVELSKQASLGGKAGARASSRTSVGDLEAKVRSLKDEFASARLAQLAQFEKYQASRPDLRQLVLALEPGKPG